MNRDLETTLRNDARRLRRPAPRGLADRIQESVLRAPAGGSRPSWLRAGSAVLAAAALITVLVILGDPLEQGPPETSSPTVQALLELEEAVPTRSLQRSEDLLLREVVLLRTDAENAIDYVLEQIPERVRPLVLLDRIL